MPKDTSFLDRIRRRDIAALFILVAVLPGAEGWYTNEPDKLRVIQWIRLVFGTSYIVYYIRWRRKQHRESTMQASPQTAESHQA